MATIVNGRVRLNNGQMVTPQQGGWYDGQQFWNGTLSNPGQINSQSNQQGAGQQVSNEVVAQTNPNNVAYLQANRDPVQEYINERRDVVTTAAQNNVVVQAQDKGMSKVEDYLKNNPFAFDEAWLASTKKMVQEQVNLEPYYKEKLSNYLTDVDTQKQRTKEDQTTILGELERQQKLYEKQDKQQFQEVRLNALEGVSDAGLIGGGAGQRKINQAEIAHDTALEGYVGAMNAKKNQTNTEASRTIADIDLNTNRFKTDLEREKQLRIETEMLNRKNEKQTQWQQGLYKASGQVIPGYMGYLG